MIDSIDTKETIKVNNTQTEASRIIDHSSGELLPTPARKVDLATIYDVKNEMAKIYRGMKCGSIEPSDGTKLVYVLSAIGKLVELNEIEARITLLENK